MDACSVYQMAIGGGLGECDIVGHTCINCDQKVLGRPTTLDA